jgi:hypothetical protein
MLQQIGACTSHVVVVSLCEEQRKRDIPREYSSPPMDFRPSARLRMLGEFAALKLTRWHDSMSVRNFLRIDKECAAGLVSHRQTLQQI